MPSPPITNVPGPGIAPTGIVIPTESAILAGAVADIQEAFGGGLNLDVNNTNSLSTPQGQLASSLTAIFGNAVASFAALAQQFDPAFATGRFQDALARMYFLKRQPALPTILTVTCSGLPGVVIPVNSQITDGSGNVYVSTSAGTITAAGSVTLQFANLVAGPILVPTSVSIFQAIVGWDSANVQSGILGQDSETRSAFETRRQNAVAANSVGSVASIRGAVLQVAGVTDAYVTDNSTNGTATIGGVNLIPNSLYVAAAYNGSATGSAVAQAIWSRKIPGCSYNGNVTFTILDTQSGYSPPFPSYQVKFQIPDPLPIFLNCILVQSNQIPSNAATLIQTALLSAFAGGDGGPRAQIGGLLLSSRFIPAVTSLGPWAQVREFFIASPNDASASIVGHIDGSVLTVTAVNFGTLAAFQLIFGSGLGGTGTVVPGTIILSQLSGAAGGTGTYSVENSQMTLSGTLTATAVNSLSQTQVNINQTPQLFQFNIFVSSA